jgi:hypothetical protein
VLIAVKPVKTMVQEPPASALIPPSSIVASGPSSSADAAKAPTGLVACDYAEARASAHRVF